jgi:hypothetical protein
MNGDGFRTGDNEGFIRVYQSTSDGGRWLNGKINSGGMDDQENCGHMHAGGVFSPADDHTTTSTGSAEHWTNILRSSSRVCYLGGDPRIFNTNFLATDPWGAWVAAPGGPYAAVAGQPDANYLIPINRAGNPDFKGVIFVDGDVSISGTLRGRVTVAATGSIHIVDDLVYASDPGLGTCADLMGMFAANDVIVSDNTLNAPVIPTGSTYYEYDDTDDEYIHGVVLALSNFTVENYDAGSSNTSACETTPWGRGCLYLTGGIIQRERGAVGLTSGRGYLKRYSYDQCAATQPPPYFPTTGHFVRGALYEVDPVGFDIAEFFDLIGA